MEVEASVSTGGLFILIIYLCATNGCNSHVHHEQSLICICVCLVSVPGARRSPSTTRSWWWTMFTRRGSPRFVLHVHTSCAERLHCECAGWWQFKGKSNTNLLVSRTTCPFSQRCLIGLILFILWSLWTHLKHLFVMFSTHSISSFL